MSAAPKSAAPKSNEAASAVKDAGPEPLGDWVPPKVDTIIKSPNDDKRSYLVLKELGRGGMGVVFLVKDLASKKEMAMKCEQIQKKKDPLDRTHRLKNECLAMLGFRTRTAHHLLHAIDYGSHDNDFAFIVMPLIWKTLADLEKCNDGFSKSTSIQVAIQTLQGIQTMSDLGFLHRDIKPANIAIGRQRTKVYLLDYGMCRYYRRLDGLHMHPRKTVTFGGTPLYASVRALSNHDQCRSDDVQAWFFVMLPYVSKKKDIPYLMTPSDDELIDNANVHKAQEERKRQQMELKAKQNQSPEAVQKMEAEQKLKHADMLKATMEKEKKKEAEQKRNAMAALDLMEKSKPAGGTASPKKKATSRGPAGGTKSVSDEGSKEGDRVPKKSTARKSTARKSSANEEAPTQKKSGAQEEATGQKKSGGVEEAPTQKKSGTNEDAGRQRKSGEGSGMKSAMKSATGPSLIQSRTKEHASMSREEPSGYRKAYTAEEIKDMKMAEIRINIQRKSALMKAHLPDKWKLPEAMNMIREYIRGLCWYDRPDYEYMLKLLKQIDTVEQWCNLKEPLDWMKTELAEKYAQVTEGHKIDEKSLRFQ